VMSVIHCQNCLFLSRVFDVKNLFMIFIERVEFIRWRIRSCYSAVSELGLACLPD
jgi:hypothetical protein